MAIHTPTARTYSGNKVHAATAHTTSRKSSTTLWTIQGLLALTFLFAGVSKLVMSAEDLTAQTDLSANFLRFIGVCETFGAVGLILPALLKVRPGLTPLAAAGLVVIMAGATVVTLAAGEGPLAIVPAVVGVLAAYVCYARTRGTARSRSSRAHAFQPAA